MGGLNIESDFTDYYDILNDKDSLVTYRRFRSECKQRGTALKYLRSIGIKTVEVKQVNNYFIGDGLLVVYTNPAGHEGTGKKILSVSEALRSYGTCIASVYKEPKDLITLKYLQIGKRRFTLYYKKSEPISLDCGKLIDIREQPSEYNRILSLPIYSIDYISDGTEMKATDFNEVQSLKDINIDNYIRAEDVMSEVRDAILTYNKI